MVVIVVGLGGGTGTGAAPVIACVARELGALTVCVATRPFYFEGKKRLQAARGGFAELQSQADSVISISGDRLIQLAPQNATFLEMLRITDETVRTAVRGVADPVLYDGLIGLDFADVHTVMLEPGFAIMGEGRASGASRA